MNSINSGRDPACWYDWNRAATPMLPLWLSYRNAKDETSAVRKARGVRGAAGSVIVFLPLYVSISSNEIVDTPQHRNVGVTWIICYKK